MYYVFVINKNVIFQANKKFEGLSKESEYDFHCFHLPLSSLLRGISQRLVSTTTFSELQPSDLIGLGWYLCIISMF